MDATIELVLLLLGSCRVFFNLLCYHQGDYYLFLPYPEAYSRCVMLRAVSGRCIHFAAHDGEPTNTFSCPTWIRDPDGIGSLASRWTYGVNWALDNSGIIILAYVVLGWMCWQQFPTTQQLFAWLRYLNRLWPGRSSRLPTCVYRALNP